jgi:hypothetical protein
MDGYALDFAESPDLILISEEVKEIGVHICNK